MTERTQRRLAAIVSTDVVGYSRLMGVDEVATLASLRAHRADLIDPKIAEHGGRIVKTMGDGLLLEFPSTTNAVRCSIDVQEGMKRRNATMPDDESIRLRIGINLGDIIVDGDDIFGDGFNVSTRLQEIAEPCGIVISQSALDTLAGTLRAAFVDSGEPSLKNIDRPVRVWSWPRRLTVARIGGKPRVYIAEFVGRSDTEAACAADLRDELRAHLSRLTGLEVVADRRHANYVVECSVRISTARSRVFAQLLAADGKRQLWSDRYDESTDDQFEILDRCAPRMALAVRLQTTTEDAQRASERDLDDLSLEELLSRAGLSFTVPTKAGWQRGGQVAERALAIDPNNFMALILAASGLGLAEFFFGFRRPDDDVLELAIQRSQDALRLNNRSDLVYAVRSGLLLYGRRHYGEAAAAARRSLELNPEYNTGLWGLAAVQVFAGDYEAGTENALRAMNVDVRDPYVHIYCRMAAFGHFGAGRFDDAVDWFQRADQLAPALPPNLMGLVAGRWRAGNERGARDAIKRLVEDEPGFRLR